MKKVTLPECLHPLYDLAERNAALSGILTAGYTDETISSYMSEYYASETGVITQTYDMVAEYQRVFSVALSQLHPITPRNALEFGCGYGSATYAMAEIFPDMRIVATELSLQMLIRHKIEGMRFPAANKKIIRCQLNADDAMFTTESFDVVFGSAILHHTLDPLKIIEEAGRILRPDGVAIFCEPFEPGYGFLKLAYKLLVLLAEKRITRLDRKQKAYLVNAINHWDSMVFLPRSDTFFTNIDDKWIFPYAFFDDTAKRAGFDIVLKQPIVPAVKDRYIKTLFDVHTTGNGVVLPREADELVALMDSIFTTEQLQTMPHDGVLILQKTASRDASLISNSAVIMNTPSTHTACSLYGSPLVSIVIPVFNGTNYLEQAIRSALNQTYPNCEILVINDGSTDDGATERLALSFGDNIRYFYKENGGVASALNMGIEQMRGEYFSWLSHDDVYKPEKVATQVEMLQKIGDPLAICYTDFEEINALGEAVQEHKLPSTPPEGMTWLLLAYEGLHGCSLLIPRKAFILAGNFNTNLPTTQDYDMWLRLAEHCRFYHIPTSFVQGRNHPEQDSKKLSSHQAEILNYCNNNFSRIDVSYMKRTFSSSLRAPYSTLIRRANQIGLYNHSMRFAFQFFISSSLHEKLESAKLVLKKLRYASGQE